MAAGGAEEPVVPDSGSDSGSGSVAGRGGGVAPVDRRGPVAAPPRRRWALRVLGALLALVVVAGLGLVAGGWWAVRTPGGSAWLAGHIPGLELEAPRGALLGDFAAGTLRYRLPGGHDAVTLTEPAWTGLRLDRTPGTLRFALRIDTLSARRVDVALAPSAASSGPPTAPTDLRLPLEVEIGRLSVGELHATPLGAEPVRDLRAALHLGAAGGAEHRIDGLALGYQRFEARGDARIATTGALDLRAVLGLAGPPTGELPGWSAGVSLVGPLAAIEAQARLRSEAAAGSATPPASSASSSSPASGPAGRSVQTRRPAPSPRTAPTRPTAAAPTSPTATPVATVRTPPSLTARATLHPFAAWPLGALDARIEALDLAAFAAAAPTTSLGGTAIVESLGVDRPAAVRLALTNDLAGRWDQRRLPVRRIEAELAARPDRPDQLDIRTLNAELGATDAPAGRITGQGRWAVGAWNLDAALEALRPVRLDARAPAMQLAGRIVASVAAPAAPVELRADIAGSVTDLRAARDVRLALDAALAAERIELRRFETRAAGSAATLSGTLARVDSPAGDAGRAASGARIAGEAASGAIPTATRPDDAPWALRARAGLVDFDPAVWWPGGSTAWRGGASRLNATADLDLRVPASALGGDPAAAPPTRPANATTATTTTTTTASTSTRSTDPLPAWLGALRGQAALRIARSQLAGVPLSGEARFDSAGTGRATATFGLEAVGNRASGRAEIATGAVRSTTRGANRPATDRGALPDHVDLSLDAPALAALTPAWRLLLASRDAALAGSVKGTVQLSGRWPSLATQGRLDATGLRIGLGDGSTLQAAGASADWTLASTLDAKLEAHARLNDAALLSTAGPGPSLESLQLELTGTARAHTLELRAASKARPPAWAESLQGGTPLRRATGTTALLQADGGFLGASDARRDGTPATPPRSTRGGAPVASSSTAPSLAGWRGTLRQLDVRSDAPGATPLVRTENVAFDARWADGPASVVVQPGRATLLAGALRWSRLAWRGAATDGASAQLDADAELEPIRIAPLLAVLQPGFGWGGDLTLGGRLKYGSTPTVAADVVLERRGGDLTVTDEFGTRSFGLTTLTAALQARDGTWRFTEKVAGAAVGTLDGSQTVRSTPQALWPTPDAPLDGRIDVAIDDLGNWGGWLPPGWRVGGALKTAARFGGRFGAPTTTGRADGQGLWVRNFLLGVNVNDGTLALRLDGETARLEKLSAQAGGGRLTIDGDATLGAAPRATLHARAERFQLLGRVDRRVVASGDGQLRIDPTSIALDGRFDVDEGSIDFTRSDAPTLGPDVTVVRASGVPSPAAAASAAARPDLDAPVVAQPRAVALDLRVGLGQQLRIRGRGLDAALRGDLRITSPNSQLAIAGTVRVEDGTYDAYGQKLGIDRGLVTFAGSVDNPRLDIEATRRDLDVRVGVVITGTPSNPRVRLFSDPDMSDIDKISYLITGHASDGSNTALLQSAAVALLSGEGGGASDRITKALGLDEISFKQGDSSNLRSTVVGIGKQISKRWYVGYERGLNATSGSFQLVYRLARRFTLRAQSGDDNALDLIWTWRWK